MKRRLITIFTAAALLAIAAPAAYAATPLEVSGWLPYWKQTASLQDTSAHFPQLSEANLFGYTVKKDGTLNDAFAVSTPTTQTFIAQARYAGTKIIPSVMWSDTGAIAKILGNTQLRKAHEQAIVQMVQQNGFDGVDIDYEGKLVATKNDYSSFLKELKSLLGPGKQLDCTIEARTPADSLNTTKALSSIEYANDYSAIGTYCDRVRLMTYDQQSIDKKLNAAAIASGVPYTPVADTAWVNKVFQLAKQTIPANKLVMGIATYGYEYKINVNAKGQYTYATVSSFNPAYAMNLATARGITPERNSAGELSFSYLATSTQSTVSTMTVSNTVPSAELAQGRAKLFATQNATTTSFYYVDWSDAQAIQDKLALAKSLGIRGVAFFKFDGAEDQGFWGALPRVH